jgi:hypothetical protein
MKRLVQPELMAGLLASSVETEILTAFAIASHVSPDCTTRVVLQVPVESRGVCTRKSSKYGENKRIVMNRTAPEWSGWRCTKPGG